MKDIVRVFSNYFSANDLFFAEAFFALCHKSTKRFQGVYFVYLSTVWPAKK
jgi:hypothetical protein